MCKSTYVLKCTKDKKKQTICIYTKEQPMWKDRFCKTHSSY